ncbi:AbrB/MazE/SpoVT family DNA-binding domain-containing protein [Neobacillus mesonae]|uniref:AbrB/MazE/SpoVT family DNA-binding domain-containing protein n=1 Tax=Neobacillus mesonae TaxID=1193713 RepID=UPI002572B354|nr:AbrB/MazE/SpoVT family DNA-binding domain-containing protein [Neobacillus mesonae]
MKSTGIVRKVDELGRIVIPRELRTSLDIQIKDPLEIFVDDERIILHKYQPSNVCMLTGEVSNDNKRYSGDIILSPQGAQNLYEELKAALGSK